MKIILILLFSTSFLVHAIEPAGQRVMAFANNSATVILPEHVTVFSQENSISAKFGTAEDHLLELSFSPVSTNCSASGIDLVRSAAERKGLPSNVGKGRIVLMELAGDREKDGQIQRIVHWQIGVPTGVFVLTITAPMPMSPALSDFLSNDLNRIVGSLSPDSL